MALPTLKLASQPVNQPSLQLAKPNQIPQPNLKVGAVQQPTLAPRVLKQPLNRGQIVSIGTATEQRPTEIKPSLAEFAQRIKEKYPDYQGVDDEELALKILEKYPEYQAKVDFPMPQTPEEKQPGFGQSLLQSIAKPVLRVGSSLEGIVRGGGNALQALGNKITGDKENEQRNIQEAQAFLNPDEERDFGYLGKVKPYAFRNIGDGAAKSFADTLGGGLELGSYAIGGGGVASIGRKTLQGAVKQGLKSGVGYGMAGGAVGGLGAGLQEENPIIGGLLGLGLGTVGGAVLGGAFGAGAPLVGAGVRKVASKLNPALESGMLTQRFAGVVNEYFPKAFKPSTAKIKTAQQLQQAEATRQLGIASILDNIPEGGNLPTTVSEALDADVATKKMILDKYKARSIKAGEEGARLELNSIADELDTLADNPQIQVVSPGTATYAKDLAIRLRSQGQVDPSMAEDFLAGFNKRSASYWANPDPNQINNVMVDSMVANRLRNGLEDIVNSINDTAYAGLRRQYGALAELEKIFTKANARLNNKQASGFFDGLADILSAGDIMQGVLSGSPTQIIRGATTKGVGKALKYLNDPDRLTAKMFKEANKVFQKAKQQIIPTPPLKFKQQLPPAGVGAKVQNNVPIEVPPGGFQTPPIIGANAEQSAQGLRRVGGQGSRRSNRLGGIGKDLGKRELYSAVPGGVAGIEKDEQGNIKFDAKKGALGMLAGSTAGSKTVRNLLRGTIDDTSKFKVGLSAVKGKIAQEMDEVADKAIALVAKGDYKTANELFTKITNQAQKVIQNRFKGTDINIKMNGVGFGVYKGTPEPNIDFTANVKPKDVDLFHKILTDISEQDFVQDSFLTYRPIANTTDVPFGIVDKAKGISNEPYLTIDLDKPLTLEQIGSVNKALEDAGLEAMSLKNNNKTIDLLNLTPYNNSYDNFIEQAANFAEKMDKQGIRTNIKHGVAETRFIGGETSGATSTYQRNRSAFYKENKGFAKPEEANSKVIEAIAYKSKVSKKELQSIVNSNNISPVEKQVFEQVLNQLEDGQITPAKVQGVLRSKLLTLKPEYKDRYVNYGWDNLGYRLDNDGEAHALVFDSNFEHGYGTNHYDTKGLFGHTRFKVLDEDGVKKGYLGEIQSDVFQHKGSVEGAVNKPNGQLIEAKATLKNTEDLLSYEKGLGADANPSDIIRYQEKIDLLKRQIKQVEDAEPKPNILATQFGNFARKDKYRNRLIEETINEMVNKHKVDEVLIATPSTVAKLEGYVNAEGAAPYESFNGRQRLDFGDEIGYGGEEYIVVGVDGDNIQVAPKEKVHDFDGSDWAADEASSYLNDAIYEMESLIRKEPTITPERAQELIDNNDVDWLAEKVLKKAIESETTLTDNNFRKVADDIYDDLVNDAYDNMDLSDMYEYVASETRGGGSGQSTYDHYWVSEVEPETFGQPDTYDAMDVENVMEIDADKKLASEQFDSTQMGVLDNYYAIKKEFVPKYERLTGTKAEEITDDEGNTWIKLKAKPIKKTIF